MTAPYYSDEWLSVYAGDCRAVMATLEPGTVDCVITSPPYYGLRDYGHPDQLGLEPNPGAYLEALVAVFRDVRRLLNPRGTLWLNLGDSYADRANQRAYSLSYRADRADVIPPKRNTVGAFAGLKAKDRMMLPARLAIALQADGWWLRDEIVWHKPNPMPSSTEDRTTPAHEMVYLLTASSRYDSHFDAIRERREAREVQREARGYRTKDARREDERARPPGKAPHTGLHRVKTATDPNVNRRTRQAPDARDASARSHGPDRHPRSVWTIPTEPYPGEHFAVMPRELARRCLVAGSPAGGLVLDPFGGSGTTAEVANRWGRRAIHIDLSDEYVQQAVERCARARAAGSGPALDIPLPFAADGLWAPEAAS